MSGFEIVHPAIEDYLLTLAPARSPVQQAIEADPPAAIVGPLEGQLLYLLARVSSARHILEVGTAVGYSALWLARALAGTSGRLVTIEQDSRRAAIARENFRSAGCDHLVEVQVGEAMQVLPTLQGPFDLIFVDILRNLAGPEDAPRLLTACEPLLRPGGLLIADNVLVDGEVTHAAPAPRVQGILAWNRRISDDPQWESAILPLRDGISVSRKKDLG